MTNLSTLELFVVMKPFWSTDPLRCLAPVRGLCSELVILSNMASSIPSRTTCLQQLRIVLSEFRSPLLNAPLLYLFTLLDRVLSQPEFRHLEKLSIALAISSEAPAVLRMRDELEKMEEDICTAFAGTAAAHGVRICCEALNLVVVHDECDFWEIRKKEGGTAAESVCIW